LWPDKKGLAGRHKLFPIHLLAVFMGYLVLWLVFLFFASKWRVMIDFWSQYCDGRYLGYLIEHSFSRHLVACVIAHWSPVV
jgi:hypothetical protein